MDKQTQQEDENLQGAPALIQANQSGKIAPLQADRLMRDLRAERQRQKRMIYMSGVVFLVITVVFALMPYLPIPIIAPPIVWVIGVIVWYVWLGQKERPVLEDIKAGKAQIVTGIISKSTNQGYHVTIDGIDYATTPEMYAIFRSGEGYTLYVTPQSHVVLSAERLNKQ